MTPLIDVIFLMLLFFMLSSTFSRFSDVEMSLSGGSSGGAPVDNAAFLRLREDAIDVNGAPLPFNDLVARLTEMQAERVIVSVRSEVTAQRLTDLLVTLRAAPDVEIMLLGDE